VSSYSAACPLLKELGVNARAYGVQAIKKGSQASTNFDWVGHHWIQRSLIKIGLDSIPLHSTQF
jgi:hypothetical protein